jgi:hypothetical protein
MGLLFIAEQGNHRIRKVENGFISTYAGAAGGGFNGDGHLATATTFNGPNGVMGDSNGNIYVADTYNSRIRMIYAVNSTATLVTTIIGSGYGTPSKGRSLATTAIISYATHVAVDTNGDFYTSEYLQESRVRKTVLISAPTGQPSRQPTGQPTGQPFGRPTAQPSRQPTGQPTAQPKNVPTSQPSRHPSAAPSFQPSRQPTQQPSSSSSAQPSAHPTNRPSSNPSSHPTFVPTGGSSARPTEQPSRKPSNEPSSQPSNTPSSLPSYRPSNQPTSVPSDDPSGQPSSRPSTRPTSFPTFQPTCLPIGQPTTFPSSLPSSQPSVQPASRPTSLPSSNPTFQPTVLIVSGLKQSITGFYNFDDGSLNDKSGNGNNGKAHGGMSFTSDRFGSEKSSIEFDGSSGYIEVPTKNQDQLVTNFTLSFWIYPNMSRLLPGTVVFDKSAYFENTWGWSLIYFKAHLFKFSYSVEHSGRRLILSSNRRSSVLFDVPDYDWSHITLVKEFQTLLVYRDGYLANSTSFSISASLPYSSLPLVIGTSKEILLRNESNMNSTFYSGGLDDIFIYDRALSAEEIIHAREFSAPTSLPSGQPSTQPSLQPSSSPTRRPSSQPISFPSGIPTRKPSGLPSSQPTVKPSRFPTNQPTSCPSNGPTNRPTIRPSGQPTGQPSSQPVADPSSVSTSQPLSTPTMIPSVQPSSRPTNQPTSFPSTQPSSQPTKNRFHCTVTDNKFYSPIRDDCVPCPLHSFLNHTGDDTCYCNGGYYQAGVALSLNCTVCSPGQVSLPGSSRCTQCQSGFFANSQTNICELCPLSFYSSDSGQTRCTPCPAGRATATLGSTNVDQCISLVPNFSLGFFALFLVIVIFSWYIVFGKFQRVSFERKTKIVTPNIEKCKQVLLSEIGGRIPLSTFNCCARQEKPPN